MTPGGCISVITVVRNSVSCLEETIVNVIEMKSKAEIEYIVIDGASTDGTVDLINRYADHIAYWKSESDNGIYDAMNKGWTAAKEGSFILFLGAGDRIISLPVDMSRYAKHDVVYGAVQMGEKTVFRSRTDFHLKLYNSLHHQALLINKALHPLPPFNCSYRIYADFDFNQRLKRSCANFLRAPDFIGYSHPGGVSDQQDFDESLSIVQSNFGVFWKALAFSGYYMMRMFPVLKRLRPYYGE